MSANTYSAFHAICDKAIERKGIFVSLYVVVPYYGGPEEGGWWGEDTHLEASQQFDFEEDAANALADIKKLAEQMSVTARKDFGRRCLEEIEWCEARNLDHETFLREPDGPERYFVVMESTRGSFEHQGCRHYE